MMRPALKPCPNCGAGVNDNNPGAKKEIKIIFCIPLDTTKKDRRGCNSIIIRCKKCGFRIGPYYQKKEDGKIVETVKELKLRAADAWNHSAP